jgi:plasmid stabilization system protein ParE
MGFAIIFSPQALTNLAEIVAYVAQSDPTKAEKLGNELVDRVQVLAEYPHIGTPYRKRPRVRMLHARPYIIYYRVKPRRRVVESLRYWHAARVKPKLRG